MKQWFLMQPHLGRASDLEGGRKANMISSEFLLNNKMPCNIALQKEGMNIQVSCLASQTDEHCFKCLVSPRNFKTALEYPLFLLFLIQPGRRTGFEEI